jgi:hypothetical protein
MIIFVTSYDSATTANFNVFSQIALGIQSNELIKQMLLKKNCLKS